MHSFSFATQLIVTNWVAWNITNLLPHNSCGQNSSTFQMGPLLRSSWSWNQDVSQLHFYLEAQLGKDPLPGSLVLLAELSPCGCRTWVPTVLLAVAKHALSNVSSNHTAPSISTTENLLCIESISGFATLSLMLPGARKKALFQKASVTKSDSPERSPFLKRMVPTRQHDRKTVVIAHHIHRFHLHPRGSYCRILPTTKYKTMGKTLNGRDRHVDIKSK